MGFADAAEGVRATLAAYVHALDDGRTDDIVSLFTADAVCEIQGQGTYAGHDELRAAYEGWKPRLPQRHLVLNTHVTLRSADEAQALSDVVFLLRLDGAWVTQLIGRYDDTLRCDGDRWLLHRRVATFVS